MVLFEFAMSPLTKGESVSSFVARSLDIIDKSGLAKNTAQLFSLFGFAILVQARRWLCIADSQVAP